MFQSMCSTPFYGSDCEKDIVSMVSGVSSSLEMSRAIKNCTEMAI